MIGLDWFAFWMNVFYTARKDLGPRSPSVVTSKGLCRFSHQRSVDLYLPLIISSTPAAC